MSDRLITQERHTHTVSVSTKAYNPASDDLPSCCVSRDDLTICRCGKIDEAIILCVSSDSLSTKPHRLDGAYLTKRLEKDLFSHLISCKPHSHHYLLLTICSIEDNFAIAVLHYVAYCYQHYCLHESKECGNGIIL